MWHLEYIGEFCETALKLLSTRFILHMFINDIEIRLTRQIQ